MKKLSVILVVLALMATLAWWFFSHEGKPAPASTALSVPIKLSAPVAAPPPVAVQPPKFTEAAPKPANLAATPPMSTPAEDYNMNVPIIGEAPLPTVPGPETNWGQVHFEDGQKVVLTLVTGQPVTITPHVHEDGTVELNAEVHYPTDNDLMVLPTATAKPGEEITFAIGTMDVKLTPTSN